MNTQTRYPGGFLTPPSGSTEPFYSKPRDGMSPRQAAAIMRNACTAYAYRPELEATAQAALAANIRDNEEWLG